MTTSELHEFGFFEYISPDELKDVVLKYEFPQYIYSRKIISQSYLNLRNNFDSNYEIFYAQKSNPNHEILKHINSLGIGCDTASKGEIVSALNAGFNPNKIMFTGPSKRPDEIEFAIKNNLMSINVESVQELKAVNKIARDLGKIQDILVRINPIYEAGETTRIIGGTGISKFGIDIEQIDEFMIVIKNLKNVSLNGIHIFNSSQILDWRNVYSNTKNVIDTALSLSREYSFNLRHIDLGGGFGIPYDAVETDIDITELGESLSELINRSDYRSLLDGVKLIYEPGRYLSGKSGIYLTKILYTKSSRGKDILLIDGGIHHLIRPALIGTTHPIFNLTAFYEKRNVKNNYMIAGPLCTSLDTFGENIELAESRPGDILAVLNAGAYGYTESMPNFLSHSPAVEKFLD
ncbi:MAG: diaminopimelate decarboxylase [Candidatus Kapaibacterium sp.]